MMIMVYGDDDGEDDDDSFQQGSRTVHQNLDENTFYAG